MTKITGTTKAVSNKDGKYGINVNDIWYNGFGSCPANKGDFVEIEFEVNGIYKNIKQIEVTKGKPSNQESINESARLRRRTDCLRMACDLVIAKVIKQDEMNKKALELVEFVEGVGPSE